MKQDVLIIDDDEGNLLLLSYALKSETFRIFGAQTAEAAQTLMLENEFKLIFVDLELVDANGLDLAEDLRKRYPEAVVAMATAIHTYDAMLRACQIGVKLYVVKPFNIMNLVNFVKHLDLANFQQNPHMTVLDNRSNWRLYTCTQAEE